MVGTTLMDPSGQPYELLELLGEGGFGEVYLARRGTIGKRVAVKLLKAQDAVKAEAKLRDEARVVASLQHPAILAVDDLVKLRELWETGGPERANHGARLALVTEFIEGEDLSGCLQGEGRMPHSTLVEVVGKVAWALHAAWKQREVVHRDVKPSNIRVGVHGTVKLLDFGIARSELLSREASATHGIVGTLRYLAPERFHLGARPRPASDVFSLGCVLYVGVTGRAFYGDLDVEDIAALTLVQEDWERLLEENLAVGLPESLLPLLRGMLAYRVEERWTAAQVGEACEALTARWPGHVTLERWCRSRWPESGPSPSVAREPTQSSLNSSEAREPPSTRFEPMIPARAAPEGTAPVAPAEASAESTLAPVQSAPEEVTESAPSRWPLVLASLLLPAGLVLSLSCAALVATGLALWPSSEVAGEAPPAGEPGEIPAEVAPSEPEVVPKTPSGPEDGLAVSTDGTLLEQPPEGGRVGSGEGGGLSPMEEPKREKAGGTDASGDPFVRGALDNSAIEETIKRHRSQIRSCYQGELAKYPSLGGKIVIKFTIARDGAVSAASLVSSTVGNASVEDCIVGRFLRMRFPPPQDGGIAIVSYPVILSPDSTP